MTPKDPIEAFAWLLAEFRRYTENRTTWLNVRKVLHEAEGLRDQYLQDKPQPEAAS
jgi:hypothetical protein